MTLATRNAEKFMDKFANTSIGAQTMEAVDFLGSLQDDGRLPGYTAGTNVSSSFVIPGVNYPNDKTGWQTTSTNVETFPISRTFDLLTNAPDAREGVVWHYTVVKPTKKAEWHVQKAWQTDHAGKLITEFPVGQGGGKSPGKNSP